VGAAVGALAAYLTAIWVARTPLASGAPGAPVAPSGDEAGASRPPRA
jgi:hypothetical protein